MPTVTRYHSVKGRVRAEDSAAPGKEPSVDYVTDALGSVVGTASASSLVNRYRYKPYGDVRTATIPSEDPDFLWVGAWGYRSTGRANADAYVRARHYSSREGRWTTTAALWPHEVPYGYSFCAPTNYFDRSGLLPQGTATAADPGQAFEAAYAKAAATEAAQAAEGAAARAAFARTMLFGRINLYFLAAQGGWMAGRALDDNFHISDWILNEIWPSEAQFTPEERRIAEDAIRRAKEGAVRRLDLSDIPDVSNPAADAARQKCKSGDCSEQKHHRMEERNSKFCKGSCNVYMSCDELRDTMLKLQQCRRGRREIMDVCFRGGDKGHNTQMNNVTGRMRNCLKYARRTQKPQRKEKCSWAI